MYCISFIIFTKKVIKINYVIEFSWGIVSVFITLYAPKGTELYIATALHTSSNIMLAIKVQFQTVLVYMRFQLTHA